jgi:hypothetical protein
MALDDQQLCREDGRGVISRPASELTARLGPENAAKLSAAAGGTKLWVPGNLANAGRLRGLLGDDLAVLLVLHFGGARVSVPLSTNGRGAQGKRVDPKRVKRLIGRGWSDDRIARHLGCSGKTVFNHRAKLRPVAGRGDAESDCGP